MKSPVINLTSNSKNKKKYLNKLKMISQKRRKKFYSIKYLLLFKRQYNILKPF